MANPDTKEDTHRYVSILGKRFRILEGYPKDTLGCLVRSQIFINYMTKHVKKMLFDNCAGNTNPSVKPWSLDAKFDSIHKHAFCDYL